ncbi:hypothetical protein ACFQ36_17410, partial [Arthrobacter sp. GCM10027362]
PAPTALTVAVPDGLVTPGQPGADVPVEVRTDAGTAAAGTGFHALPPPPEFTVPVFTPEFGRPGQTVVLHGRNFHYGPVQLGFGFRALGPDSGGGGAGASLVDSPRPTELSFTVPESLQDFGPGLFPFACSFHITTAGGSVACPSLLIVIR